MISNGLFLTVPETIMMTPATGESSRSRLPARLIGIVTASTLMPAAAASGIISGTIAKNSAVPEPDRITISAVRPTSSSGRTKPSPPPWTPVIAFCSASIRPIDCRPTTNTDAATSRATTGIAPPMPLKKDSVSSRVLRASRVRTNSQMIAMTKDRIEASCTLMSILRPVMEVMANTTSSMMIGSNGRMP